MKLDELAVVLNLIPKKKKTPKSKLIPISQKESSGNTNLALAVFGCLWESLIVFANDWVRSEEHTSELQSQ